MYVYVCMHKRVRIIGHCDQTLDCHLCGICSAKFYNVERFIEHKKNCSISHKQNSIIASNPDSESVPIDLSSKSMHQMISIEKQLLELYAQLAASHSRHTDSEQSSDDGGNTSSYDQSPPSSNGGGAVGIGVGIGGVGVSGVGSGGNGNGGIMEKIHPCVAERCQQHFSSRGALLWHILRRHPGEKLLQCKQCEERFADPEQQKVVATILLFIVITFIIIAINAIIIIIIITIIIIIVTVVIIIIIIISIITIMIIIIIIIIIYLHINYYGY
ncbi:BMA-SEM-4 [Dirofilaria immitis]|nr:BMA-SEM-4 [Dirofilaria immitis]